MIESSNDPIQRPWLDSYPPGMPAEIDLGQRQNMADLLDEGFRAYAERPAFENMGTTLSYAEVARLSAQFAAWLRDQGLEPGDRVALMMPNLLQYPIAMFGVLRAGLVVVNTNPLYTARELQHQLADSGARAIVILENFAHVLEKIIGQTGIRHVVVTGAGDLLKAPKRYLVNAAVRYLKRDVPAYKLAAAVSFNRALEAGARLELSPARRELDDLAFLQYTGGTTGLAKGAMLTHRNLLSNIEQSAQWISAVGFGRETIITALPLYHVFALTANCMVFFKIGGLNRLITNPRDTKGFVKELQKAPFTAITGVNTLFNALLNTPGFEQTDFSSLKFTLGGGMAVQRTVAEQWKAVTGTTLIEAYGLTETSPAACVNPMDLEDYNGAIGLPIPSTECCVMDEEGNIQGTGEVGELCVRGPQVMKGYWNRPGETEKVLTPEGWFRTGDVARMDERGYFYIVDRKKDMILVSGFNVYPNELEDVIAAHPQVIEVGVIGVADEKSGEAVKAVVVRRDESLSAKALREWCKEQMTGYKVPRYIEFVDELPKTNVGKILRRELREGHGEPVSSE